MELSPSCNDPQRISGMNMIPPIAAAEINTSNNPTTSGTNHQSLPDAKVPKSSSKLLKSFLKFSLTPFGFLTVIYGLNVIAWGGMLFLLLCNAASSEMCTPSCTDQSAPRNIWIEIDSQIVNGLFCVAAFGSIPWRGRDLYYLLLWRIWRDERALGRLVGRCREWFRLGRERSRAVDGLGPESIGDETPTCTGTRAPPTAMWKLDFVVWARVLNTCLQAVLAGLMWGYNRYDRPSWAVGLLVGLACFAVAAGGIVTFTEGRRVKKIEELEPSEEVQERVKRDSELGILCGSNVKDEKLDGRGYTYDQQ